MRPCFPSLLFLALFCVLSSGAQSAYAQTTPQPVDDYSGMYSFLRDGEFIQITVEDSGNVSGFISRYGDTDSDKDTFLDQFFDSGKLNGAHLTFKTKAVHGSWFTFDGTLERGAGKSTDEEGYYVARGTLIRFQTDSEKKTSQESRSVAFKSFPRD